MVSSVRPMSSTDTPMSAARERSMLTRSCGRVSL
jgi:hypothetical protein